MGATVYSSEGTFKYAEAKSWVVDDRGRLHIVGPKGNLGSFNDCSWDSVHEMSVANNSELSNVITKVYK